MSFLFVYSTIESSYTQIHKVSPVLIEHLYVEISVGELFVLHILTKQNLFVTFNIKINNI